MNDDRFDRVMQDFARALFGAVNGSALSKTEICKRAGISRTTLYRWLQGKGNPQLDKACALEEILGTSLVKVSFAAEREIDGLANSLVRYCQYYGFRAHIKISGPGFQIIYTEPPNQTGYVSHTRED